MFIYKEQNVSITISCLLKSEHTTNNHTAYINYNLLCIYPASQLPYASHPNPPLFYHIFIKVYIKLSISKWRGMP